MGKKNLSIWLPHYLKQNLLSCIRHRVTGLKHILFLFVDHFELAGKSPRLSEWLVNYPKIALKHQDAEGQSPKHTWFYALDLLREPELEQMQVFIQQNLGEVELHWHHANESSETFQEKLEYGLPIYQKYGYMRTSPNDTKNKGCFGFIHGNWSLDNSCGDEFCGVNNEIELLIKAGCYGDFTFPALYSPAQPSIINSIYYAIDDGKPKSYNKGRISRVGVGEKENELMIFEGPLTINWKDWRFKWHPMFENGDIGSSLSHNDPKRIDAWIRNGAFVKGRPDWVFVKVFCHGGQDYASVLSNTTDEMFSYLEKKYNDGHNYQLHYITSREAYNIVKAAEDGHSGNPNDFRNYKIPFPEID